MFLNLNNDLEIELYKQSTCLYFVSNLILHTKLSPTKGEYQEKSVLCDTFQYNRNKYESNLQYATPLEFFYAQYFL